MAHRRFCMRKSDIESGPARSWSCTSYMSCKHNEHERESGMWLWGCVPGVLRIRILGRLGQQFALRIESADN